MELEKLQNKEQLEISKIRSMPGYQRDLVGEESTFKRLFGLAHERLGISDGPAFVLKNTSAVWFNHFVEQVDKKITETYYANSQDLIYREADLHAQILRDWKKRQATINLEEVFARMAQLPCDCKKANKWRQAKDLTGPPYCGCALRWQPHNLGGDCVRQTRTRMIKHDKANRKWIRERFGTGDHPLDPYRKHSPSLGVVEEAKNQLAWCLCYPDFELFFQVAQFEITSETAWEDRISKWEISPQYFEGQAVDFEVRLEKKNRKKKQPDSPTNLE
jgi:hypothetical protein